jgi:hypothetical protein
MTELTKAAANAAVTRGGKGKVTAMKGPNTSANGTKANANAEFAWKDAKTPKRKPGTNAATRR